MEQNVKNPQRTKTKKNFLDVEGRELLENLHLD